MKNINFKFDGSYLVAEINDTDDIIQFHMEMLTHNNINYLLPVKRQLVNNSVNLYYETVGCMPLDRLIMHKKLSGEVYREFVKNTLSAVMEIGEYQLVPSGIVLDKSYIFVNPVDFIPHFVYVPIKNNEDGLANIVGFLKSMVVSNMVEVGNGNIMQQIINVLNSGLGINEMLSELRKTERKAPQKNAEVDKNKRINDFPQSDINYSNDRKDGNLQNNKPPRKFSEISIPQNISANKNKLSAEEKGFSQNTINIPQGQNMSSVPIKHDIPGKKTKAEKRKKILSSRVLRT